jgi:hypothetical protein
MPLDLAAFDATEAWAFQMTRLVRLLADGTVGQWSAHEGFKKQPSEIGYFPKITHFEGI